MSGAFDEPAQAETIRRQLSQAEEDLTASEAELAGMVEVRTVTVPRPLSQT